MVLKLLLIPLLLLAIPYTNTYQYSVNITLVNMGEELSPDLNNTPYYYLLHQNIFPNTTYQTVILKEVLFDGEPAQFITFDDKDGNPCIKVLTNKTLGKNQAAELVIAFVVQTRGKSFDLSEIGNISQIPKELSEEYSLKGPWDMSNFPNPDEILATASSLKGEDENALRVLCNILSWFEENMRYNAELVAPQDIWTTFSTKSGDCDDQANLFVLFCRALGIPAYVVLGPIYMPEMSKLEADNNMIFNLTHVAWHGWAMVYLPTKSGGGWYPVDLTFFKDAYYEGGHIKSRNLLDHINGSAFSKWDALEYLSVNSINYINETITARNEITRSNVTWMETHIMISIGNGTQYSQGNVASALNVLIPAAIILSFALVFTILIYRKSRGRQPGGDPSST
ncbi:MAG: transglutaminase-like domain-containing protein [Candidatus Methanomethyliaceae archaeon]|nr:transglutaminase-like domain-containing protein [Candidatus Methanomethyliaceae archaeon]